MERPEIVPKLTYHGDEEKRALLRGLNPKELGRMDVEHLISNMHSESNPDIISSTRHVIKKWVAVEPRDAEVIIHSLGFAAVSAQQPRARSALVELLGYTKHEKAIEPLGRALQTDSDAGVRNMAVTMLGHFDSEAAKNAVNKASKTEKDKMVQRGIAWALENIDKIRADRPLRRGGQ